MSRVRRLGISGIRNFGPGDDERGLQTIRFSHPLTMIFGPNGTGKTTIIEALKYASTGDFPPGCGAKNQNSFVHDALLTDECSVKGVVIAEMCDTKGNIVTVSRRLLSVQKKFKKGTNVLDTTLSTKNIKTGEKVAISHRCADVDLEMGLALGVSKPILNHVIFCHQEDSTWPLEDGKKLKERFDQIFDSDKYNKAVERIRKYNNKMKNDLRVTKAQRESLEILLEESNQKKKSLEKYETRLAKSIQKVSEVVEKMKPLDEKMNELRDSEAHYIKLHTEKETKKTEYGLIKQQIMELKESIQVLHDGTAEELQKEIAAFDNTRVEMESEMEMLKNKSRDINKEESKLKVTISNKQLSIGKLKEQAQALEKNISLRNRKLNQMRTEWGLDEVGEEVTETEAAVGFDQLKDKLTEMERNIKDIALKHQAVEKTLQEELDALRDQKSKLESGMILFKRQIAEKRTETRKIRAQIEEVNMLASQLELVDSKLQEANTKLDTMAASFDVDAVKKNIEDEITKRDQMELSLDKLDEEVKLLQQQSSLHAELDLLKSSLAVKEKDIQKLKNKHQANLKMLLKTEVLPESNLKHTLNRIHDSFNEQIKQLNHQLQKEQRVLTTLETTKKHHEHEMKEKNSELEDIQDKIATMCHGIDYEEVLLHAKKTVQDLQDSKGMYAYKSIAYKDYIKKTDSCCPLCHRNFDSQQEIEEFKSELNEEVNKYPNQLKTCEEKLKVQQERYDSLLQLKPLVDKVKQIEETTLKKLRNDLIQVKQKLSESHARVQKLQLQIAEPESKLAQCKDIVCDVAQWDQYSAEVVKLNQSIARVKARLSDKVGERSMQEAQAEQEFLRKSLSTIRKRIEKLQSSLSTHNDKLQQARESRNRLVEEQLRMKSEVQKLNQLQDKLKDLHAEEVSLQEKVQQLQVQLGPVNQNLAAKNDSLQKIKREHRESLDNDRSVVSQKSRSLHDLNTIQSQIDNSIRNGVTDSLRKSELDMKKYQQMDEELQKNKIEVTTKINEIINEISKQETRKRDMSDNMMLKEKGAAAVVIQREITELREKLGNMNYRQLLDHKKKLLDEEELLIREKNLEQGGQDEMERNIKQLKLELNKEVYRLALKNYMRKSAEVVVQEEAINDLVAYTTALDRAIIEFHEERMASVNRIILRLWTQIYKGKDTTAIQIHTDSTEGMGSKKRVYNYKVVQEKQKVTMDMKGRCSAGQKVLASIIIRMALAETFAKNCGIFALDEPTTNLDVHNIKSLAQALVSIVNLRSKQQKNFQLIVISHDEDFITQLGKVDKVGKVYELYRNEKGLTEVKELCIENNATFDDCSQNGESSGEEDAADVERRSRKRKELAEERKNLLKGNSSVSPQRKKRNERMNDD